jgi:hypothetical protein
MFSYPQRKSREKGRQVGRERERTERPRKLGSMDQITIKTPNHKGRLILKIDL